MKKKIVLLVLLMVMSFESSADLLQHYIKNPAKFDLTAALDEDCTICTAMKERQPNCPAYYNYFINQTMRGSLYSAVIGDRINKACVPNLLKLDGNIDTVNNVMKDYYKTYKIDVRNIDKCLTQNKIEGDRNINKKIVMAYMYGLNNSIEKLQQEKIKEIALSDQFLNKPVLDGVYCVDHTSLCDSLKSCKQNPKALDETVDFSMTSLKEIVALEKQKLQLLQKSLMGTMSGGTRLYTGDVQKDIDKKIDFVRSMNPWLQGDVMKKEYKNILKLVENNKTGEASKLLKDTLTKQVTDSRKLQLNALINLNLSQNCVLNNSSCDANMLYKMNKLYTTFDSAMIRNDKINRSIVTEASQLKDVGNCMASLKSDKEDMDATNIMVAKTAASLAFGAAGGVVRLGSLAMRFYESGNAIKGIASAGALVGMATIADDTFKDIKSKCKEGINRLAKASQGDLKSCSNEARNIYRLRDLKSCITDIALTTIPGVMIVGGSVKALKTARALDSSVPLLSAAGNYSAKAISLKITNKVFSDAEKQQIAKKLEGFNITKDQLDDILSKINKVVKTKKEKDDLQKYVNFVNSLKPKDQLSALKQLEDVALLAGKTNPGGYVAQFYQKEKKFNVYETYKQKVYEYQLKRQGMKPADATKKSKEMAASSRKSMQDRFYACRSSTITPEHKKASSRFIGLSMAIGIGGTVNGNYQANKDKFQNDKMDWFGKLGYDIAIVMVMSKINQRMVKTSPDGLMQKYVTANASFAGVGTLDAVVYSRLYGVTEKDAQRKIEEIKNSPNMMKELKALEKYIDKTDMAAKFENQMVMNFKKVLTNGQKETMLGKPPYLIGGEQFNTLTAKDLDNPAIRKKIVNGLVREMNTGAGNPLISTGDLGADRWVNDRMWNAAVGVPKGMVTGMVMYQILCLGADRPFASLGVATGFQFINQFFSGSAYYQFRKENIGQ